MRRPVLRRGRRRELERVAEAVDDLVAGRTTLPDVWHLRREIGEAEERAVRRAVAGLRPADASGPVDDAAAVHARAARLARPLAVVDVGARFGLDRRWAVLAPNVRVVGFEPDAEEARRLAAAAGDGGTVEAVALADAEGPRTLTLTADPACASLYPPDPRALRDHPALGVVAPVGELAVATTTLDAWAARTGAAVDVLKLDVQGAELDVLRGATGVLAGVVALEVEVEFTPIYAGQPLFADVDAFLRAHGFGLWRLGHLVHYGLRDAPPAAVPDEAVFDSEPVAIAGRGGRLSWAHAWYVADDVLDRAAATTADRLDRAAVAAAVFGFGDLAAWLAARADAAGAAA